mgnify:CR=1 FL=1
MTVAQGGKKRNVHNDCLTVRLRNDSKKEPDSIAKQQFELQNLIRYKQRKAHGQMEACRVELNDIAGRVNSLQAAISDLARDQERTQTDVVILEARHAALSSGIEGDPPLPFQEEVLDMEKAKLGREIQLLEEVNSFYATFQI